MLSVCAQKQPSSCFTEMLTKRAKVHTQGYSLTEVCAQEQIILNISSRGNRIIIFKLKNHAATGMRQNSIYLHRKRLRTHCIKWKRNHGMYHRILLWHDLFLFF